MSTVRSMKVAHNCWKEKNNNNNNCEYRHAFFVTEKAARNIVHGNFTAATKKKPDHIINGFKSRRIVCNDKLWRNYNLVCSCNEHVPMNFPNGEPNTLTMFIFFSRLTDEKKNKNLSFPFGNLPSGALAFANKTSVDGCKTSLCSRLFITIDTNSVKRIVLKKCFFFRSGAAAIIW